MAAQVKLVEREDRGADVSTLSLYNDDAGFSLKRGGWIPKVADDDAEYVIETIPLIVNGSSHDDLSSKVQSLDAYLTKVPQYDRQPSKRRQIWLRDQLTNETEARQAVILEASRELSVSHHSPPSDPGAHLGEYIIALKRLPFWEEDAYTDFTNSSSGVSATGGIHDYTTTGPGDVVGDVPARIAQAKIWETAADPIAEMWIGFRAEDEGITLANFYSVWELEDGDDRDADTSIDTTTETDTASPGNGSGAFLETTFSADASMITRTIISAEHVAGVVSDDQIGTYTILLRAKVGSGTTARVRMFSGIYGSNDWRSRARVEITSTNWYLYELGTFTIPVIAKLENTNAYTQQSAIDLKAERTGGSGSLYMDCLIFIPTNHGAMHILVDAPDSPTTNHTFVWKQPNGNVSGGILDLGLGVLSVGEIHEQGPWKWSLPIGDGRIVMAAQRSTQHLLEDELYYDLRTYQRWRFLRGSED